MNFSVSQNNLQVFIPCIFIEKCNNIVQHYKSNSIPKTE